MRPIQDDYIRKAYIDRVYDGDTYWVTIDMGFNTFRKEKIRILGIDTPELRGPEKTFGMKVAEYVKSLIPDGSKVYIRTTHMDSFGRWLADLWFQNESGEWESMASHLVDNHYAKIYRRD